MNLETQTRWGRRWFYFKTRAWRNHFDPPLLIPVGGVFYRMNSFVVHGRYRPGKLSAVEKRLEDRYGPYLSLNSFSTECAIVTHVTTTLHRKDAWGVHSTIDLVFTRGTTEEVENEA